MLVTGRKIRYNVTRTSTQSRKTVFGKNIPICKWFVDEKYKKQNVLWIKLCKLWISKGVCPVRGRTGKGTFWLMSYICLIANENGMAAAGDSRLTMHPKWLKLHFDAARKVFVDEKQGLIWACCGITVFGGVNYFHMIERVLRSDCRSMGAKLRKITDTMKRVTLMHHTITRKESAFTLLLTEKQRQTVTVLEIVNGRACRREFKWPAVVEGGFSLAEPLPNREDVGNLSLEQLIQTVRQRTMDAVKQSAAQAKEQKQVATVGGQVRVVYLEPEAAE